MAPYLTVITGPMFSGKTEELIRRLRRYQHARKKILAVKPAIDTRQETICARQIDGQGKSEASASFPAMPVANRQELSQLFEKQQPDVLAIDEAQFFDPWIVDYVKSLLRQRNLNLMIYVIGLDQDAWGKPFGHLGELMVYAHKVVKLTAVCFVCSEQANLSFKKKSGTGTCEPGDADIYEARCLRCWEPPQ